ncbi:hypothetical protein PF005_g9620 [Phytophthora fragariae]|uniref:Secreted protein n=1 Tax=Phytophthora fragariae TaxID=53985 RepID=A0A6A3TXF4_9STRA|nr:hypothetical protein PF003_g6497 [Phytophthora fragariae]KAE8939485.1 hypothetical protein PF009_g10678 [Phytophthora fragariae]KAE9006423.1 hypothetical protein PF011_g11600 [Phytophthora fragariae]KAE9107617.1 hypothetical protein PF010_g12205 [Phytophthora fragariae]KAE9108697.1 hypothetical protein PF007_g12555 [Phytophthora fragariae]
MSSTTATCFHTLLCCCPPFSAASLDSGKIALYLNPRLMFVGLNAVSNATHVMAATSSLTGSPPP